MSETAKPARPHHEAPSPNGGLGDLDLVDPLGGHLGADPKLPFEMGIAHYDQAPPDVIEDLDGSAEADRFRFANRLPAGSRSRTARSSATASPARG